MHADRRILVITATLGTRPTLSQTIRSVREIGGEDVRHVIVCPQSQIEAIQNRYNGIECLAEPEGKRGIYPALNHGFETFGREHRYLTFINDDDYWRPDFKRLIDAVNMDATLDLVYGKTCYLNENGVQIGVQACSGKFKDFVPLLQKNIVLMTQQATLLKSNLFFKLGGFDESYKLVADTKFWAELSLLDIKYKYIDKVCAAYMIQDGQLSSDQSLQQSESARLLSGLQTKKSGLSSLQFRLANTATYLKRMTKKKGHRRKAAQPCKFTKALIMLMPWRLKRHILNKYLLYDLAPSARIGLSFVFPKFLSMGEGARIDSFVTAIHLDKMVMGENSSIGRQCWITGFPTGTDSQHFAHDTSRKSELILGKESAITKEHHIDCTNSIHIGEFTTVAGYRSQLLTHSIDLEENRQDSHPIEIGDYCFVSTGVKILGGSRLPSHSVLAAGAVLNRSFDEEWRLYGGVPAKEIKEISKDAKYFTRESGFVY